MYSLHAQSNLAHGDIKPDNMMFSEHFGLMLIDLGHADTLGTRQKKLIGTEAYRAPEMTGHRTYLIDKVDIYAMANTLFAIMFQDVPFGRLLSKFAFNHLYNNSETKSQFFSIHYGNFFETDERHSLAAQDLLFACLNPDPAERPSIEEALASEWIQTAPH